MFIFIFPYNHLEWQEEVSDNWHYFQLCNATFWNGTAITVASRPMDCRYLENIQSWSGFEWNIVPLVWVVRYWRGYLSWARCKWFATPSSLALLKSRMVLPFWCWLTQVVLVKRLLKRCSVVVWYYSELQSCCSLNCTPKSKNSGWGQLPLSLKSKIIDQTWV